MNSHTDTSMAAQEAKAATTSQTQHDKSTAGVATERHTYATYQGLVPGSAQSTPLNAPR